MAKPRGFILYEGPSAINGEPIVCIATLKTTNQKTGDMVQTWILPAEVDPLTAVQTDQNDSVCGGCPLQGKGQGKEAKIQNRVCYVNLGQAPAGIWKAYKNGSYPTYDRKRHEAYFAGRRFRWGAYGDPAAVPVELVEYFCDLADGHTGYSHQLLTMNLGRDLQDRLAKNLMASCHTPAMWAEAKRRGYRAFLAVSDQRFAPDDMLECPNYTHGISCEQCKLCSGNRIGAKSIYVIAHAKTGLNLPKIAGAV